MSTPTLTAIHTADGKPLNGQTVPAGQPLKLAFVGNAPGTKVVIDCWIGKQSWHWWSDQAGPVLPAGNAVLKARYQGNGALPYPPTLGPVNFKVAAVTSTPTTTPTIPEQTGGNGPAESTPKTKIGAVDLDLRAGVSDALAGFKFTSNRVWISPNGFTTRPNLPSRAAAAIDCYRKTGAVPIFCVTDQPTKLAGLANAAAWCVELVGYAIAYADADPRSKGMVIRIEPLQEPDLAGGEFLEHNDFNQWVNTTVAIAKAVKAKFGQRVQVISGGLSYDTSWLAKAAPGIAPVVDMFGYHGYAPSVDAAGEQRYIQFRAICTQYGKPGVLTEFGLGYGGKGKTPAQWAADLATLTKFVIQLGIEELCFYPACNTNNSPNSAGALAVPAGSGVAVSVIGSAALAALKQLNVR